MKRYLKNWVEKILVSEVIVWICFVATTIESLGNNIYNLILVGSTLLTIINVNLLIKFGKSFQD